MLRLRTARARVRRLTLSRTLTRTGTRTLTLIQALALILTVALTLEFAALGGHAPCVEALLRWLPPLAAPEAGVALPALHCAALQGTECVGLLLAAAPAQLHTRGAPKRSP